MLVVVAGLDSVPFPAAAVAMLALCAACRADTEPADLPEPARPPPRASAPRSPGPSSPAADDGALPPGWRLPDGWVWVTETRDRFAVGLPALPRSLTNAERTRRVLVAETREGIVRVTVRPDGDDPAGEIREAAAANGVAVAVDTPFRGDGRRLEVETPAGREIAASLPLEDGGTLVVSVLPSSAGTLDVEALLGSIATTDLETPRPVRHADGRFRLEAPARMDTMNERSASPPIRGLHGVLDGHQLAASFVPARAVPTEAGALQDAMRAAVAGMPGELLSAEPKQVDGRAELWFRCRATDGSSTTGTVRITFAHGRLYTIGVYSPAGQEPAWAARTLASLVIEE